jgi:hypothetical protein
VGGRPTGATARRPVAWMAGRRETKALKLYPGGQEGTGRRGGGGAENGRSVNGALYRLCSADRRTIYPIAHLVAAQLIAPLAVLALGTGVLLGILTPRGLLQYWWVTIKLALTAVLTAAVAFVLVPRWARLPLR